jgi:hypothetical protein
VKEGVKGEEVRVEEERVGVVGHFPAVLAGVLQETDPLDLRPKGPQKHPHQNKRILNKK